MKTTFRPHFILLAWLAGLDPGAAQGTAFIYPFTNTPRAGSLPMYCGNGQYGWISTNGFGSGGAGPPTAWTADTSGAALAAIQGLNQKLEQQSQEKDAAIQALKQNVDELKKMVQFIVDNK